MYQGLRRRPNEVLCNNHWLLLQISSFRSSPSEVFLGKGVLKICSKFTGEHPCRSAISIKLLNTPGRLLLFILDVCGSPGQITGVHH